MKIVHLSDTHVGVEDNLSRLNRIVDKIIDTQDPSNTIVIHTGDLIESYGEVLCSQGQGCLNRLTDNDFQVLLVPGNHDYGHGFMLSPSKAEAFREYFDLEIFGSNPEGFPVINRIGDCMFIGLDSSACELGFFDRLFAEGNVGADQRADLSRALNSAINQGLKTVVYMHHHPFIDGYSVRPDIGDPEFLHKIVPWLTRGFRRLKDAYSLIQVLRDKTDILLFGHHHLGMNHAFEAERYGMLLALDGSSSTATRMDTDSMRVRVIDTDTFTFETLFIPFK